MGHIQYMQEFGAFLVSNASKRLILQYAEFGYWVTSNLLVLISPHINYRKYILWYCTYSTPIRNLNKILYGLLMFNGFPLRYSSFLPQFKDMWSMMINFSNGPVCD